MRFSARVFAIVTGSIVLAFGGKKLYNMNQLQPSGAGFSDAFVFEDNKNCDLKGKGHQGRITGNHNAIINCGILPVQILNNRNIDLDITTTTLTATNQSHAKVYARKSNIVMESDENIEIKAEGVRCKFAKNKNLIFSGEDDSTEFLSMFVGNRNGKFRGNKNKILAFNNRNLMVGGNNNHLEISETRNHDIQPASKSRNTFTIKTCGGENIQYAIHYVDKAIIKERKYQLGIFEFSTIEDTNKVSVTMEEVENIVYSIVEKKPNFIIYRAEKNGVIQTLELKGQRVDAVALNSINIFV